MITNHEPIDITPEGSVVPIYLVPTTNEELAERLQQAEELAVIQKAQDDAKQSALQKLSKLGLTEEEAKAIIGI